MDLKEPSTPNFHHETVENFDHKIFNSNMGADYQNSEHILRRGCGSGIIHIVSPEKVNCSKNH